MTRILSYLSYIVIALTAAIALGSCEDRIPYPGYEDIPEGISTVKLKFTFPDYTPALDSRAAGNAMGKIRTLWLAIYQDGGSDNGKLVNKLEIKDFVPNVTEARPGSDESTTGHAEFNLTFPNGRYRIYAVVNHDLSDADISSEDKLYHLPLTWQDDETNGINHNDQMFGWFRHDESMPDFHGNATSVVIKPGVATLHAWVRRAASKLTVAFNTNGLNENVFIYLKSISIVDIPKQCYLHSDNNLGEDNYRLDNEFAPAGPSSTIYFAGAEPGHKGKEDHRQWPVIGAGDLVFGLNADAAGHKHNAVINLPEGEEGNTALYKAKLTERINELTKLEHDQTTRALYFYENMQAPGELGTASDKRQIVGENLDTPQEGLVPSFPNGNYDGSHNEDGSLKDNAYDKLGWKDAKPWGTYVEIRGYYDNSTGKGDIVYRFMMGKNSTTDYEAERNHHYKLTLVFNGDANDVDFHIDYEEEAKPGLFTPTETYVPYLYNQESFTTIRATPKPGYDLFSLKAVIIDNEWRPYKGVRDVHYWGDAWDAQIEHRNMNYTDDWGVFHDCNYAQDFNTYPKDDSESAENCEFGFLSLWKLTAVTREANGSGADKTAMVNKIRDFYFKHNATGYGLVSLGARSFTNVPTANGETRRTVDSDNGTYTISRTENPVNGEIDYIANIPLFTRAKTIDSWAVYSGANPFYEHNRYARIKFYATYKKTPGSSVSGPEEYTDESYTDVLQARRINNPTGIYRSQDKLDAFHVNLMYMKPGVSSGNIFESVVSRGPWKATIESDPNGLVQLSANGQVASGKGGFITGRTNTEIDFTYKPLKKASSTTAYGAVITVTYHNNTCVHKIIVRQGYAAHKIGTGSTKFSAFNVYDQNTLVKNPLSVGSFFRPYNDLSYPIAEKNNTVSGLGVGQPPTASSEYFVHGHKNKLVWGNIQSWRNPGNYDPFYTHSGSQWTLNNPSMNIKNGVYRLPTYAQTLELGLVPVGQVEDLDNDVNFAFGITYGDGADGTLSTEDAYGFSDPDNTGNPSKKGVRSLIVYSKVYGDNLMFPFGATGHGRRRNKKYAPGAKQAYGYLRYGDLDSRLSGTLNHFRPMAWDLPNHYGAVYWTSDENRSQNYPMIALDINSGDYMVSRGKSDQYCYIREGSTNLFWDALLIRPVKTN